MRARQADAEPDGDSTAVLPALNPGGVAADEPGALAPEETRLEALARELEGLALGLEHVRSRLEQQEYRVHQLEDALRRNPSTEAPSEGAPAASVRSA